MSNYFVLNTGEALLSLEEEKDADAPLVSDDVDSDNEIAISANAGADPHLEQQEEDEASELGKMPASSMIKDKKILLKPKVSKGKYDPIDVKIAIKKLLVN
jgi:hypothetical protein